MFTRNDLIDVLRRHLAPQDGSSREGAGASAPAAASPDSGVSKAAPAVRDEYRDPGCLKPLCGRRFLTEYEIKQALTPLMKRLTIPKDAIVSPLAQDWLALKGIRIIRSS